VRGNGALLRILPLIDVAWADGEVSGHERDLILAAARARGVEAGSEADRQVAHWLAHPPSSALSGGTLHVLGALMYRRPPEIRGVDCRDLLDRCTAVAEASGGILGFRAISSQEERVLNRIRYELDSKDALTAPR
jgi:hypothetical protein